MEKNYNIEQLEKAIVDIEKATKTESLLKKAKELKLDIAKFEIKPQENPKGDGDGGNKNENNTFKPLNKVDNESSNNSEDKFKKMGEEFLNNINELLKSNNKNSEESIKEKIELYNK